MERGPLLGFEPFGTGLQKWGASTCTCMHIPTCTSSRKVHACTSFVQAVCVCASCSYKWSCMCVHTCPLLTRNHFLPPPPDPQSWIGGGILRCSKVIPPRHGNLRSSLKKQKSEEIHNKNGQYKSIYPVQFNIFLECLVFRMTSPSCFPNCSITSLLFP